MVFAGVMTQGSHLVCQQWHKTTAPGWVSMVRLGHHSQIGSPWFHCGTRLGHQYLLTRGTWSSLQHKIATAGKTHNRDLVWLNTRNWVWGMPTSHWLLLQSRVWGWCGSGSVGDPSYKFYFSHFPISQWKRNVHNTLHPMVNHKKIYFIYFHIKSWTLLYFCLYLRDPLTEIKTTELLQPTFKPAFLSSTFWTYLLVH